MTNAAPDHRSHRPCRRRGHASPSAELRHVCNHTITRPDDAGLSERVRAYLGTRRAKRSVRRRGCWVETPNAELKERHGLRRAQCRGRAKVQMQAYGAAIAYNIKKLVATIPPQPVRVAAALSFTPRHRMVPADLSIRGCYVFPT